MYFSITKDSWVIAKVTVTKTEAAAATPNAAGNSVYYTGSDGKYYKLDGEAYIEIEKDLWIIPAVGRSDAEIAQETAELIADISANVTLTDKAAVEAAHAAYDALTEDQKALVSADTLKKLTDV